MCYCLYISQLPFTSSFFAPVINSPGRQVCGVDYEMDDAPLNEVDVDDVVVKLVNRAEEVPADNKVCVVIKAIYKMNNICFLI